MKRLRPETSAVRAALLSSLFFLALFTNGHARTSRVLQQQRDYSPSSCGVLRNISYPFRLKGDPPNRGDPDYELVCEEGNKTVLDFHTAKYYVKDIVYENKTLMLIDVGLANGTCNLPYKSFPNSAYNNDDYRYTIAPGSTWVTFVNCSVEIDDDPMYTIVPCLSGDKAYLYAMYDVYRVSHLKPSCRFVSMVPVAAYYNYKVSSLSFPAIQRILQTGFGFSWSLECRNCPLARGICSAELIDLGLVCKPQGSWSYIWKAIKFVVLEILLLIPWLLVVLLLFGRTIFAPICIVVYLIYTFQKRYWSIDSVERFLRNHQTLAPVRYSYTDLIGITSHFKEKLGQGGFGSVFKGKLPGGFFIAVKMLGESNFNGEDFINEVSTIGRIHHMNVVRLIGFCSEGSKRALVYEYLPNGSLDKYIFAARGTSHSFDWEKLNEIALGTAQGLEYLHRGCDMCILHFDIKPHNILLDHNFTPKVSDFGLAKLYPKDTGCVSVSTARGTVGYIAPELISRNFGAISDKSDVYSFGMLLLEMAGGRRNAAARTDKSSLFYFPSWVFDQLQQGVELQIENMTVPEEKIARKLCIVGLWCIQMNPNDRPSMTKVVEMLDGNTDALLLPPKPFLFSPQQIPAGDHSSSDSRELSVVSEFE